MKTNINITRKISLYSLIGLLSLFVISCGSYQNSSYYENDGIYGTNGEKIVIKENQSSPSAIQYKDYFNSLQYTDQSGEFFTDVSSYAGNYGSENDSIQAPSVGYAAWGSSPNETNVTVYPDSYWSVGFGFGYPYYGYGWGYPYYGWGYPGYGWGYPGYGWGYYPGWGYPGYGGGYYPGYATPYSYNSSRRGSAYGGRYNTATPYGRNYSNRNSTYSRNNVYNRNNVSTTSRNGYINRGSSSPTFTNRNSNTTNSRNYSQGQARQSNTPTTTRQSYTPSNSYTPSSSSRSGGSNMSGGGRMSSGGGGGRMSGGGGGRR